MAFHATLQRLREAAGYPSARAFFMKLGGPRWFGCTYKQYRNAEAGRSVPSPRLADKIAAGLRLEHSPTAARRFMESYLEVLLGSERLVALALGAAPRASASAMDAALTKAYERPHHLTKAQTEFMYACPENYWAFFILSSDSGSWSPEDLARVSGLKPAKLARALDGLRKQGMAQKDRDGRWRSPFFDRNLITAPDEQGRERYHALAEKHLGLDKGLGKPMMRQLVLVRAAEADLAHYKPILIKALQGASIFSTTEAGPDTALFAVETRIRRIAKL